MPNALNDRLISIRNTVKQYGIVSVDNDDLTLMITYPVVIRYDLDDDNKGNPDENDK